MFRNFRQASESRSLASQTNNKFYLLNDLQEVIEAHVQGLQDFVTYRTRRYIPLRHSFTKAPYAHTLTYVLHYSSSMHINNSSRPIDIIFKLIP